MSKGPYGSSGDDPGRPHRALQADRLSCPRYLVTKTSAHHHIMNRMQKRSPALAALHGVTEMVCPPVIANVPRARAEPSNARRNRNHVPSASEIQALLEPIRRLLPQTHTLSPKAIRIGYAEPTKRLSSTDCIRNAQGNPLPITPTVSLLSTPATILYVQ